MLLILDVGPDPDRDVFRDYLLEISTPRLPLLHRRTLYAANNEPLIILIVRLYIMACWISPQSASRKRKPTRNRALLMRDDFIAGQTAVCTVGARWSECRAAAADGNLYSEKKELVNSLPPNALQNFGGRLSSERIRLRNPNRTGFNPFPFIS